MWMHRQFSALVRNEMLQSLSVHHNQVASSLSDRSPQSPQYVCLQFSALVRNEMVQSLSAYYEPKPRRFHTVLVLGTDVCGYPRITHGAYYWTL